MRKRVSTMTSLPEETTFPSRDEVVSRQEHFRKQILKLFLVKYCKYQNMLKENGIVFRSRESDCSFEEEVEIIVSEKRKKVFTSYSKQTVPSIRLLFRHIYHAVITTKASRIVNKLQDISESDIKETIATVAKELSVAYEYQIAMLKDGNDINLICNYLILCFFCYLKSTESIFNVEELLTCVLEVNPSNKSVGEAQIKTKIGKSDVIGRHHARRWRIQEIIKQPGLRVIKPEFPDCVTSKEKNCTYNFYGCFTPYGELCRPEKYGYRSPLHCVKENTQQNKMILPDLISSRDDRKRHPICSDIHQQYRPYTYTSELWSPLNLGNNSDISSFAAVNSTEVHDPRVSIGKSVLTIDTGTEKYDCAKETSKRTDESASRQNIFPITNNNSTLQVGSSEALL